MAWARKGWTQSRWVRQGLSPAVATDVCIDLIFRLNPFALADLVTNDGVEEHDMVVRTDPFGLDFVFEKFPKK